MKKFLTKLGFGKKAVLLRKFFFWFLSLSFWKRPFIFLGEGTQRRVYRRGNYIIKLPISWDGLNSNDKEARTYQSTSDGWLFGIRYAKCKLHSSGLLIMEYVEPAHGKELPRWTCYVDCQQVGYNRRGHLVAYDYGY